MCLLQIKYLEKRYKGQEHPVFRDFNFRMEQGEFIALMGPSGSGKTTLLNLISGIEPVNKGAIILDGADMKSLSKEERTMCRRKKIGMVFQDFHLLDTLSVHDNIILPMTFWCKDIVLIEERFQRIANMAGILPLANKYPSEISGGERQRTAICRAIMNESKLILADEPTGNLDRKSARNIMEYFRQLQKKHSILMVTHDPYAASFCTKVLFLSEGKIQKTIVRNEKEGSFFEKILDTMAKLEVEQ